jgi:hypothetical protein
MALGDIIARLAVSLEMETAAFEKGATLIEKRHAQMTKNIEKFGKKMTDIGKTMSVAVTAPIAAFAYTAVQAAKESAEAMGQVESALKSMGDGAGRTKDQLAALASSQTRTSLYDDDDILRKVTANLLTFGNVAGEQFDRAQQAAIDLSARMGTDLHSSALMLGKALNEPAKGLAALRRVGIQFTEQQQEQIKRMAEAGDAAGAQAIMLAELERQFSGSAQAMRDADPMAAAKMSFAEFQETVGEKLLPILPVVADAIIKVLDAFGGLSPEMQEAAIIGAAVVAAIGPVLTLFGGLVSIGAPLIGFFGVLAPALGLVGKALLLIALNPAVLAFAAVLGGIYLAWRNWDKIEPILRNLYLGAKKWITDNLGRVLHGILNPIQTVQNAFFRLYDAVVGNSYIPDMVDGIAAQMQRLDAVMVTPVTKATTKAQEAFREMAQEARAIMDRLFPEAAARIKYQTERAALQGVGAGEAALRALANERDQASQAKRPGFDFLNVGPIADTDQAMRDLQATMGSLAKAGKATTVQIVESFKDMADKALQSLGNLSNAIKSGGFLGILESVIGLGMQLGSAGLFGNTIATRLNTPAHANGTSFHPGGLAVVGERGPEVVSMPRSSRVYSNGTGPSGGNTYHFSGNLMTPEFWAQIQGSDIAAAQAGGNIGVAKMQTHSRRRVA